MSGEKKSETIVLADVIRLIAAMLVMMFHLGLQSWHNPGSGAAELISDPTVYAYLTPFVWFGWVGVQIFFVLSGYIISMSMRGSWKGFAKRRLLRIYPMVWLCSALTLPLLMTLSDRDLALLLDQTLRTLVLWPTGTWLEGVYWTLPTELVFYMIVGAVMASGARLMIAMYTLTGISGVYWAARAMGMLPLIDGWVANILLLNYGANFALGAFIYLISRDGLDKKLLVGAIVAFGVSAVSILPKAMAEGAEHGQMFLVPIAIWSMSVLGLIIAIRFNKAISRVLSPAFARQAGLMTYPLYLLHIPVGAAVMSKGGLIMGILVSLIVSYIVALWLEPAFRKAMTFPKKKPAIA